MVVGWAIAEAAWQESQTKEAPGCQASPPQPSRAGELPAPTAEAVLEAMKRLERRDPAGPAGV
jgi:hypothetical protein